MKYVWDKFGIEIDKQRFSATKFEEKKKAGTSGEVKAAGRSGAVKVAANPTEPTMNKSEAVKAALADGVGSPVKGVEHIKKRYGIEVSEGLYSSIKSLAKKAGESGAVTTPSFPVATKSDPISIPSRNGTHSASELARQVKELIAAYGVDEVQGMVKVLGE